MTSYNIRGIQTPSPLRHLSSSFNPPSFPKMIFGKVLFYGKVGKLRNQDLAMNIIQNKNKSNYCKLNVLEMK